MQMTLQYVNEPRNPTGKYGNLKSTAGETIYVPTAMLPLFKGREGQAVDIPTKIATWGQGTEARQVTIATAGPNGGGWQGAQRAPAQQPPPQQQAAYQPAPPQQAAPAYRPPAADKDGRAIYITGVVGRAMGSGKFTASEILVLTQAAAEAYDRHLDPTKAKPVAGAPATEPPFNDALPDHMLEPDGRT